ncbi:hypothetical protein [Plantactinospora sp. KBS50]|uniref:hypothetical protein n=1 Tax=Plantactinospora sp. KBS50 TaxID=2024580 RepID=UPI000BAAE5CF|nr:hypothetical protein [Plantactinospora sp. KBS50]ASW53157.1 hypothetical protein CIK06_01600 [Plantactinospora sp. KBS50]
MQPDSSTSAQPIGQVTTGMRVVDATGREIGKVAEVRTGDPNAVTAQEPPEGAGVLAGRVPHTDSGDEPDVPADLAARLLRTGYLKIDPPGPIAGRDTPDPIPDRNAPGAVDGDRYAGAEQIARVRDGVVELAVPVGELAAES